LSLNALAQTQTEVFDFEKLSVYLKAKEFNKKIHILLSDQNLDRTTNDQLRRASFSIMLNISEGSGRFTNADKRNFYVIARWSVFECVAILDYLQDLELIDSKSFQAFYFELEELSKMLYGLIRGLSK
jgi:four helix bundle protein